MRIIRHADFRVMPWKNGGGTTIEVAISPHGASMDNFDWRVSMARVEADGPFSSFPGIDRSLTVLEGAGMTLEIAGMGARHLTLVSEPLAFPGDVAVQSQLTAGPILDLNVMTRRGVCRAHVERLPGAAMILAPGAETVIVLVRGGRAAAGDQALADGDAVRCEPGDAPVPVQCEPSAIAYRIAIKAVQG